jgi:hypothetical protein
MWCIGFSIAEWALDGLIHHGEVVSEVAEIIVCKSALE